MRGGQETSCTVVQNLLDCAARLVQPNLAKYLNLLTHLATLVDSNVEVGLQAYAICTYPCTSNASGLTGPADSP
jgi:hypothetical protein